ncbi:MAG: two-component system sensor histidine kinase AlgZ [Flavobacterium sp.]|jgi:two-component system sensor histidine kinase AlgZ
MSQEEKVEADFFLPDLCQTQNILFLVLVAELLAFVLVMANSNLINFSWADFGLSSIFVQWIVLASAGVLCNFRPMLMKMSVPVATFSACSIILSLTLVFSIIGQWFMLEEQVIGVEFLGTLARNLIVTAVMTGIAFRYFFLQHQLRRQEQAELNSRIQALQSRIRPHFLFNSMNIIASLISIDPETAEEVVEDLSVLFRASLNDSTNSPVTLTEELDLCEKYVHIEGLRLDDRLKIEWHIDVNPDEIHVPMLTLQPLLENAIYHGIQPLPEGGTVRLHAFEQGEKLVVEIFNPVSPKQSVKTGGNQMAIENIRSRLQAIYGTGASLKSEVQDAVFKTTISYPLNEA